MRHFSSSEGSIKQTNEHTRDSFLCANHPKAQMTTARKDRTINSPVQKKTHTRAHRVLTLWIVRQKLRRDVGVVHFASLSGEEASDDTNGRTDTLRTPYFTAPSTLYEPALSPAEDCTLVSPSETECFIWVAAAVGTRPQGRAWPRTQGSSLGRSSAARSPPANPPAGENWANGRTRKRMVTCRTRQLRQEV